MYCVGPIMLKNEWESAEPFPVILIALQVFSSVHIFVSNGMTPLDYTAVNL